MRILHCIETLNCGGLQKQLVYLASEQVKRDYDVHVVYFKDDYFRQRLLTDGAKLHRINNFNYFDPRISPQLFFLIKEIRPNILQTWFLKMDLLAGFFTRLLNIPWILREPNSSKRWPDSFLNLPRKWIGVRANAIISNSFSGDNYWKKAGFTGKKFVIRNCLPFDVINNTKEKMPEIGLGKNQDFILYAGRIQNRQKNIINLFYAFSDIVRLHNVTCIICGDGPERPKILRMINKYQLTNRILTPKVLPDTQIWTLMKKAKALVLISSYEGCPNVVLEAMSCGCPLVVSDIPEHREILNENAAWFIDQTSPKTITDGVNKALLNYDLSLKKAIKAKQIARNWLSIPEMAKKYEKVYFEVSKNKV